MTTTAGKKGASTPQFRNFHRIIRQLVGVRDETSKYHRERNPESHRVSIGLVSRDVPLRHLRNECENRWPNNVWLNARSPVYMVDRFCLYARDTINVILAFALYRKVQDSDLDWISLIWIGIPRGSVLSPLLLLIYIDGLSWPICNDEGLVLFADDVPIDVVVTTNLLSWQFESWFVINKLSLNQHKIYQN